MRSTTSTSTSASSGDAAGREAGALARLAAELGLHFSDERLLEQALTHGSFVHEHPDPAPPSNERLEFLGDAVLSLLVAEALWEAHPDEPEGVLTARRAAIVSDRALARVAEGIGIGAALRLGQGAERAGERSRGSVIASALEALIAAVYLDQGLIAARGLVRRLASAQLSGDLPSAALQPAKVRLQVALAAAGLPAAVYHVVEVGGPDHARTYQVEARVDGRVMGRGMAGSRRAAEGAAAEEALLALSDGGAGVPAPEPEG